MEGTRNRIMEQIRETIPVENRIEDASVSELTFKPDFLLKLDNNLTVVEIAYFQSEKDRENVDWKTLRLIEQIFEAKLFFGNDTVFILILLDKDNWKSYCRELLEGFFDKVLYGPDIPNLKELHVRPKESNFELWNLEREFVKSRRKEFSRPKLVQFGYKPISPIELEQKVYQKFRELELYPERRVGIPNLKNYYLRRDMNLRFYFDFLLRNKIIEIKSFKRITPNSLQSLLIKSRLIRYEMINGVVRRRPSRQMIMLVNGDLSGPDYDRMRYLRMLIAAGWDVFPIDILSDKRMMREVFSYA